ncbi:uncharacterized protein LACBIDRAFT_335396 [Laccaria bicolor S238N-H82]|uniref:Predicted protein n=1 Tax=Laccaria bicolor (strain S238N-H82 / ATCC MYA-4686) TaxID=486041 RepID=B0E280_LACBS|nr:uncharacterized protein LACBIDRAFT_335396 [Laccaria bicolor S238N-H82]EDQ99049.1 predicted protein [Laccaria bicolor S238N-H82]|eukprot:XP_001890292.1 predicted protein [Laccaria bicolor S238N-H82]
MSVVTPLKSVKPRPSEAERILKNRDVLSAIFEAFGLELGINGEMNDGRQIRKNLKSAALTCSAFFEPASDCLWRIMDSFMPLLNLIPSFEEIDGLYAIRGQVHWRRFDYYSQKVRSFVVRLDPGWPNIAGYTYVQISNLRLRPFFPALCNVYILSFKGDTLNLSSLFFLQVPTLQQLFISNVTDATFIESFISSAAGTSTHLQYLRLEGCCTSSSLAAIVNIHNLTSLRLILRDVSFDPYIVRTFSNLSRLVILVMDFQGCPRITLDNSDAKIVKSKGPPFQSLQVFQCKGSARPLSIILQFMVKAPLRIIDFSICKTPQWEADMTACMEAVAALKSLKIIRIVNSLGGNFDTPLSVLVPLVHLKLQVLKVTGFHLEASSSDLNTLTIWQGVNSAWRNLTCLHLPVDGSEDPYYGKITLSHLTWFVTTCPVLKELQFFVNLLEVPSPPDRPPNHSLERLIIGSRLGKWTVVDMISIARFIDKLYPRLEQLRGYAVEGLQHDPDSNWTQIESILLSYQAVRGETIKENCNV